MSGGHFDGQEWQLEYIIERITEDEDFKKDLPELRNILTALSVTMKTIIRDYDYHLSGDSYINDIRSFEKNAITHLKTVLDKEDR